MMNSKARDPRNFTLAEWQQAKRVGKDPRVMKEALRECWAVSDSQSAFQTALRERGYFLARGDRRGFVALDHYCNVFSISKWTGVRAKSVRARLTEPDTLPSVGEAREQIAKDMQTRLVNLQSQQHAAIQSRLQEIGDKRTRMIAAHQRQRLQLDEMQRKRRHAELLERQGRFRSGLRGLMDRVTGKHRRTKERNEREAYDAATRDQQEKDSLIFRQMDKQRGLQARVERLRRFAKRHSDNLSRDIDQYRHIETRRRDLFDLRRGKRTQRRHGPEFGP